MHSFIETVKKYKEIIGGILVVAGAVTYVIRSESVFAEVEDLKQIAQSNNDIAKELKSQFGMVLALAGLTPERVAYVKNLPQTPLVDSAGQIVFNREWLYMTQNMERGYLFIVDDTNNLKAERLWPKENRQ